MSDIEFVDKVAEMTMDGEVESATEEGEEVFSMSAEDAIITISRLIAMAREIREARRRA